MYRDRNITRETTLIEALKKMDILDSKLLIVEKERCFIGLISAGDIQRAILKNIALTTAVGNILREKVQIAKPQDNFAVIRKMMLEYRMELCPVVDDNGQIIEIHFWEDIFGSEPIQPKAKFNLPVVIMAGGFGTRLRPLTYVIPKPLVPLDEETMLEHIFKRFNRYGCENFYISVNYKAPLINFFIKEKQFSFNVSCFEEEKPLGTAGSLTLLQGKIDETFFVSNCDILIEEDYSEILKYHRESKNELTIIAALKNYSIPYGTIDSGENGQLIELNEKPDITLKINSGMYILEPKLLDEIPQNQFFHITHLIEKIKKRGGKVGVYPVSEKSWKDIGEWDGYLKHLNNE
jgi:dTDP-glucose pyrophosphorylase